jgi:hypothetical protein
MHSTGGTDWIRMRLEFGGAHSGPMTVRLLNFRCGNPSIDSLPHEHKQQRWGVAQGAVAPFLPSQMESGQTDPPQRKKYRLLVPLYQIFIGIFLLEPRQLTNPTNGVGQDPHNETNEWAQVHNQMDSHEAGTWRGPWWAYKGASIKFSLRHSHFSLSVLLERMGVRDDELYDENNLRFLRRSMGYIYF